MKNKGSFNINKLNSFVSLNDIILTGDYVNITRDTIISGICKTNNCGNHFIKNFRTLIVNNSFYCETCMIKIKVESRKKTHIQNCVEHPSQNAEYAEKHSKTSYNRKEYTFPSGKKISYQGFENYALNNLIINEKIDESDIITGCKNVPTIWYNDENNKKHRHYVDIFIPSQNRCIEVKSTWTAEKKKDCIFLKQNAAKELGYNYEICVYDGKGNIVNKYY